LLKGSGLGFSVRAPDDVREQGVETALHSQRQTLLDGAPALVTSLTSGRSATTLA
jgi:hypothetical protein